MLEANWGDTFEIVVNNELSEGTAVHWHGILQTGKLTRVHSWLLILTSNLELTCVNCKGRHGWMDHLR